jgi:ribosomal protein S18 acetylase RimI-like enzyme
VTISVRPLREDEHAWVHGVIHDRWGSETVVGHGVVYRPAELPGLVAERDGERVGVLTYVVEGDACEVVTIDAFEEGTGIGTALIGAARALGHPRLWLVTTNDNVRAQRFYEHLGFRLVEVREGALARSRELKPEIPELAEDGTPIRDELEYELRVPDRG